ncbi:YdbH domain-containing protein [Erythrobacter litoralis]|uniref:Exoprotein n=1 Tax=Erythrobacter litoralis (strain HTCC2594) TaxID=314225 RepID=Q2N9N8_ERYLH|nr:YdbH domain-containing protein [Erythrobacter litoralis]ABC63603.1 exoprotein [Erythrobacter litoralis HTCC2594]
MGEGEETLVAAARTNRSAGRIARMGAVAVALLLLLGFLIVWLARERIADNIIGDLVQQYYLPATYEIESIGPAKQVLTDIVIGDPNDPDLTVERVEIKLRYRLGIPAIGRVSVTRPRLYGEITEDGLTFGSLDRVIFAESDEEPGLPDLDLQLIDGRARIDSPYGAIGIKAEGEGEVDDGFAGVMAAAAPTIDYEDCALRGASAYGSVSVAAGRPTFEGPLRLASLACEDSGTSLGKTDLQLAATGDATLDGVDASLAGDMQAPGSAIASARSATLDADVTWRDGRIVSQQTIALADASSEQARFATLDLSGSLRAASDFSQFQSDWDVEGEGVALGDGLAGQLAEARRATDGSLLAPLLARLERGLARQVQGGSLAADLSIRRSKGETSIAAPRVSLRGRGGEAVAAISRLQVLFGDSGLPRIAGNISTGGGDIPRIAGRMERSPAGATVFTLQMAPYSAEGSTLALPRLTVRQAGSGALRFDGLVQADGPLPGGEARGLAVPIDGSVDRSGALALWSGCTPVTFRRLAYVDLVLGSQSVTLCPPGGRAMLRYGPGGLDFAAGATSLRLSGELAGTPLQLASGPVGFAWPGEVVARDLDVVLGEADNAARFDITDLKADLGSDIAGTFAEADIRLDAVPLDLQGASGNWSYIGGVLRIDEGAFRLVDRSEHARFNPLDAEDATLTLEDSIILANAILREPNSQREVVDVAIRHNLANSQGFADLTVDGITFDGTLQPVDLSNLALGVIANARGTVTGTGRIDWNSDDVTSSGRFSSDSLDFAAAFGPVQGASGTVEFSDLLDLTTAPDQVLKVRSINPGIEVTDGEVRFALRGGELLAVEGGSWPFMGGTLIMRSVDLNFGREEVRRYVFEIVGLEAARFVEQLDLGNFAATGTFDGTISVVFDERGDGRIEDGLLISRPPGGNVSYVGELTYEDMGAFANFAFNALRSLDFRQMRVAVEGPLTGEIVTRVRFDGVSQGEGASSNFVTRRIASLPIRFNVNIRAPFYRLLTDIRSFYDPAYVRDPREIGLLDADGNRVRRSVTGEEAEPDIDPEDLIPDQPPIQDPESEDLP